MRTLSTPARNAAESLDGNGEVFLSVLTIDSVNTVAKTFNFVNNNVDVTGTSGTVYTAYPFDMVLPSDTKTQVQNVSITIDNVDRMLVDTLRNEVEPANITVKIILASTLDDDNPEIMIDDLQLINVSWDAIKITGSLNVDSVLNQKYPSNGATFDSLQFSGLT